MPVAGALIGAAGAIGGGLIASSGAKSAANTQAQAAQDAQASQERMFEKQTRLQEPFRQAGMAAQNQLLTYLGLQAPEGSGLNVNAASPSFGKYAGNFGMQDFTADPGYAFRMSEGMKALNNSMAARGLGISGANVKGALKYGQDLGSQEYQNAFNRYQVNRANQLNPLQSLMGAGQSSANTLTSAAGQLGSGIAETQLQAGNARASGYVGSSNALANALSGVGNAYMSYKANQPMNAYLNSMNSGGISSWSPSSAPLYSNTGGSGYTGRDLLNLNYA